MKKLASIFALALVGCASEPGGMASISTQELCYRAVTGKTVFASVSAYWQELDNRRENCQSYLPMIQTRINSEANSLSGAAAGLQMMQNSRPQPVPKPAPIHCVTKQASNGTMFTDCY